MAKVPFTRPTPKPNVSRNQSGSASNVGGAHYGGSQNVNTNPQPGAASMDVTGAPSTRPMRAAKPKPGR